MPVRIRLRRQGRRNRPFFWIVVANSRSPRDGKYIEKLGYYDPIPHPEIIEINIDRAIYWLNNGAQPTEAVVPLLRKTGVLYKKYLMRGVKLGKISEEEMQKKFEEFLKRKQQERLSIIKQKKEEEEKKYQEFLKIAQMRYKKREERLKGQTTPAQQHQDGKELSSQGEQSLTKTQAGNQ